MTPSLPVTVDREVPLCVETFCKQTSWKTEVGFSSFSVLGKKKYNLEVAL